MSWLRFFLSLLLVSNAVQAQQFLNFTEIGPSECAAPAAYSACYGDVVVSTAKCVNEFSDNPTAQKGCGCTDGEGKINCFAQACWNRVRLLVILPFSIYLGLWRRKRKGSGVVDAGLGIWL